MKSTKIEFTRVNNDINWNPGGVIVIQSYNLLEDEKNILDLVRDFE